MDIITELRNLRNQAGCAPHEEADAYIQAAKNFTDFTQTYEDMVKKLVKLKNINYLQENQEAEEWYHTALIVNIKVGIKGIKVVDKKEQLSKLENKLEKEQQFMQNLRRILSNPWFANKATPEIVAQKQKKLDEIKDICTKLEYEISKLKMSK